MTATVELYAAYNGEIEEGKPNLGEPKKASQRIYPSLTDLPLNWLSKKVGSFEWEVERLFQAEGAAEAKKQR